VISRGGVDVLLRQLVADVGAEPKADQIGGDLPFQIRREHVFELEKIMKGSGNRKSGTSA